MGFDRFPFTLNEQRSASESESSWAIPKIEVDPSRRIDLLRIFVNLFCAQQANSSEEDILQCLLIMAKIHLATFRQIVHDRQDYDIIGCNVDWKARARWQRFQAYLDYFRNDLGAFSRYAKREFSNPIFQEQLDMTRELKESLLAEAQAVGSLIRDQLQVGVGMASLEESQRSIKEGKLVKLK
jgi:hypothetical protein